MASIELFGTWWGHEGANGYWKKHEYGVLNRVGVETKFYNASEKDIKYITFGYIPLNKVGDLITDVNGESVIYKKITGPIAKDTISCVRFNDMWQGENLEMRLVVVGQLSIVFMDDTTEVISSAAGSLDLFNNMLTVSNLIVDITEAKKSVEVDIKKLFYNNISLTMQFEGADACRSEYNNYKKNSVFFKKYGEELNNLVEEVIKGWEEYRERERITKEKENRKALAGKIGCGVGIALFVIIILACTLLMVKVTT